MEPAELAPLLAAPGIALVFQPLSRRVGNFRQGAADPLLPAALERPFPPVRRYPSTRLRYTRAFP